MIISISGKAGVGKDTVSKAMMDIFPSVYRQGSFAAPLKIAAAKLFGWDGAKDDKGRKLLQRLGSDVGRHFDPNIWLSAFLIDNHLPQIHKMKTHNVPIHMRLHGLLLLRREEGVSYEQRMMNFFLYTWLGWNGVRTELSDQTARILRETIFEFNPDFRVTTQILSSRLEDCKVELWRQHLYYQAPQATNVATLIVADARFPNELDLVNNLGGFTVWLTRDRVSAGTILSSNKEHISENSLSQHSFLARLANDRPEDIDRNAIIINEIMRSIERAATET